MDLNNCLDNGIVSFMILLVSFGFVSNNFDHCAYMKNGERSFMILWLYVDDILLASNDLNILNEIKDWLKSRFENERYGWSFFCVRY